MSIKELDRVQMRVAETIKHLGARSHEERNWLLLEKGRDHFKDIKGMIISSYPCALEEISI